MSLGSIPFEIGFSGCFRFLLLLVSVCGLILGLVVTDMEIGRGIIALG